MSKAKQKLQEKVGGLYDKIGSEFYLCRDDFEVNGEKYNSALLFGTLTELNRGNMLLFGEYGGGKTTSAEYLQSVFNGLPLDLVKRVAIRGNPQETKESIIGNPDYGAMNTGDRTWAQNPMWTHWSMIGPKIIDEFNRIPEPNQAIVLNIADRGDIDYMRGHISHGKFPFFATCNYADRGNNGLIPPILDRFDVAVESRFPGVANALHIAQDYHNDKDKILSDPKLTRKALGVLNSGKPQLEVQKELEAIVQEHETGLISKDFPVLSREDKERIEQEVRAVSLDNDAEQYFAFLVAEMNISSKYGQKRSIDPATTENGLYLQSSFVGSGSRREEKSLVRYAKSLAWLQNQDEVNLDHVTQVAPYVLWHRIKWTPEAQNVFKDNDRNDPLDLHITKELLGDGTDEMLGVKGRFGESQENYQRVIDLAGHGKMDEALKEATDCLAGGKGHPIFQDAVNDLKGE
ncbi:AAA family ATPase [Candidatus Pacearchaeota archaeon]|nr:AAA family ATPase [Candidatus Pacearchaeota archaeon]